MEQQEQFIEWQVLFLHIYYHIHYHRSHDQEVDFHCSV